MSAIGKKAWTDGQQRWWCSSYRKIAELHGGSRIYRVVFRLGQTRRSVALELMTDQPINKAIEYYLRSIGGSNPALKDLRFGKPTL